MLPVYGITEIVIESGFHAVVISKCPKDSDKIKEKFMFSLDRMMVFAEN